MENRNIMPDELLECKICSVTYNTTDRKPLVLPCGHTFCKVTISDLINKKQQGAIICPFDNKIHPCNIADDIPTNFGLQDLIAERSRPVA